MPRRRLHRLSGSPPKDGDKTQPKDGDRLLGTHVKAKTARHSIDKRAHLVVAAPGSDDELLSTVQMADWLGVSTQWLEIGRHKGYGPPFERLGPRVIRYRRGKVRRWLDARSHECTNEYSARKRKAVA